MQTSTTETRRSQRQHRGVELTTPPQDNVYCSANRLFVIVPHPPEKIVLNSQKLSVSPRLFKVEIPCAQIGRRRIHMSKKPSDEFSYLSNDPDFVPNPEIEEFMEQEIARAPKDPELLAHRLRNNTAASPKDAGGDLDASWEDVNDSGTESVGGDNPTPDQSMVEENANAVGVNFEDNEELDFLDKIERRDRDRYELDEGSKTTEDMI